MILLNEISCKAWREFSIAYFVIEKTKGSQEIPLSINITHEVLANMLGAHRVTVTKNINYVKELGIIDYKYEKNNDLRSGKIEKMAEDDF